MKRQDTQRDGSRFRKSAQPIPIALAMRFLSRLRFPVLFAIAAICLIVDLLLPDVVPLADEVVLALLTALLASWRKRRESVAGEEREAGV